MSHPLKSRKRPPHIHAALPSVPSESGLRCYSCQAVLTWCQTCRAWVCVSCVSKRERVPISPQDAPTGAQRAFRINEESQS